nr:DUF3114 domain-containing protein [uncultured Limosilactobacillus sp.]
MHGQNSQQLLKKLRQVGSPTYVRFLQKSHLSAHAQLALMLNQHLQTTIDADRFLQITGTRYRLVNQLAPHSCFFPYLRELVVRAYPTQQGLKTDELGTKVHLFRSYLDRLVIQYLRHYQSATGIYTQNDYEQLLLYCHDHHLALDYQTGANYHNRFHDHFTYPRNMKVQLMKNSTARRYNDARMVELVVNIETGQFVSEWNVYRATADGQIDAKPTHYSLTELRAVADTESFNYGIPYGTYHVPARYRSTHQRLDVQQPFNSAIRQQAKQYWQFPQDYQRGGSYADIVKDGGQWDVQAWQLIPVDQRAVIYQHFVRDLQTYKLTNYGIKHYLERKTAFPNHHSQ